MFSALLLAVSMFMISDREDFWSVTTIAPKTLYAEVDENGITKILSHSQINQFFSDLENKSVLLLIHGFENPSPHIDYHDIRVNIENLDLTTPYDYVIGYLWPSFESTTLNRLGYDQSYRFPVAQTLVEQAKPCFTETLSKIRSAALKVDVIAHGMGNRLLIGALELSQEMNLNAISHFFCWGLNVDSESLNLDDAHIQTVKQCESIYIAFSKTDDAYNWNYPLFTTNTIGGMTLHEILAGLPENIQIADFTNLVAHYRSYILSRPIYDYLKQVLEDPSLNPFYTKYLRVMEDGSYFKIGANS